MNEENYEIFGNYVIVESVKRMRRARKGILHYCQMIEKHPDDDRVGMWHYEIVNAASSYMLEWEWLNTHADRFTRTNMKAICDKIRREGL